ncbi:hypothetical protein [Candidatus Nitrospira salsa]
MAEKTKIVWILFGDMHDFENAIPTLRSIYKRYEKDLQNKGYTLGMSKDLTSKRGLLSHISDPSTWALVWHSHGEYNNFNQPKGNIADKDGQVIRPTDVKGASPNLKFVALLGCGMTVQKSAWLQAFGLKKFSDSNRRIAGSGDYVCFGNCKKAYNYPQEFAASHRSNPLLPYNFKSWVNQLP